MTSDPAGIDCQGDCEEVYDFGTVVTLTARLSPEAGTNFKGWSGDCTGTDTTCTVTMDQARNVTAELLRLPVEPVPAGDPQPSTGTVSSDGSDAPPSFA